jgi:hypothetical protein
MLPQAWQTALPNLLFFHSALSYPLPLRRPLGARANMKSLRGRFQVRENSVGERTETHSRRELSQMVREVGFKARIQLMANALLAEIRTMAADPIDQIPHHCRVNHEHHNPGATWLAVNLVHFNWDQGAGDDCGLATQPTVSRATGQYLPEEQSRIDHAPNPKLLDLAGRHI